MHSAILFTFKIHKKLPVCTLPGSRKLNLTVKPLNCLRSPLERYQNSKLVAAESLWLGSTLIIHESLGTVRIEGRLTNTWHRADGKA